MPQRGGQGPLRHATKPDRDGWYRNTQKYNLGWKSGPKSDPIFDQTRDGNLDPNRISFLIKLGMEICTQTGSHVDVFLLKNSAVGGIAWTPLPLHPEFRTPEKNRNNNWIIVFWVAEFGRRTPPPVVPWAPGGNQGCPGVPKRCPRGVGGTHTPRLPLMR